MKRRKREKSEVEREAVMRNVGSVLRQRIEARNAIERVRKTFRRNKLRRSEDSREGR